MAERLENYIPEPNSGCWLWLGAVGAGGYGTVGYPHPVQKTYKAHRKSYEVHCEDPGELDVLHRCDTPLCINPDHLYAGTHQRNMDDMNARGRGKPPPSKGELNVKAKLTSAQVAEIRKRFAAGESQTKLGIEYGVYQQTISRIVHRKIWQ